MNHDDTTIKTAISAPRAGGATAATAPAMAASPAASAQPADAIPAQAMPAGSVAPAQPGAAIPAPPANTPAISVPELDDGARQAGSADSGFAEKYEMLLDSYPVDDTDELQRFVAGNPGLIDKLHDVIPKLLARPDVEDIVIRLAPNPDNLPDLVLIDVFTNYTDSRSCSDAVWQMIEEFVKPKNWGPDPLFWLTRNWNEAGGQLPESPDAEDKVPDTPFERDFRKLTASYKVGEARDLKIYLSENTYLLDALHTVLPQILARPDVERVEIDYFVCFEGFNHIVLEIHTNYDDYQPCSDATWQMRKEIVMPLLKENHMKFIMSGDWKDGDDD